jgi:hypothetical protein
MAGEVQQVEPLRRQRRGCGGGRQTGRWPELGLSLGLSGKGTVVKKLPVRLVEREDTALLDGLPDAEMTATCGPKHARQPDRSARRHGSTSGSLVAGSRRCRSSGQERGPWTAASCNRPSTPAKASRCGSTWGRCGAGGHCRGRGGRQWRVKVRFWGARAGRDAKPPRRPPSASSSPYATPGHLG